MRKPRMSSLELTRLIAGLPAAAHASLVHTLHPLRPQAATFLRRCFEMPKALVYEYVTAVLDLAVPPAEGNLHVHRDGELLATASLATAGRR